MPGFVYILYSNGTGKTYTGSTDHVGKRLLEHNAGKTRSTIGGIPWKVWHVFEYASLEEARKMEKYYKTGAGRKKLRQVLENIPRP
ncbi:MAG: GIY-YIG nuclease family protein [Sphingobacteriales bacterium]|nr:GIY-YIG nuclease family protein [Sphingobacteriales bacterium]